MSPWLLYEEANLTGQKAAQFQGHNSRDTIKLFAFKKLRRGIDVDAAVSEDPSQN